MKFADSYIEVTQHIGTLSTEHQCECNPQYLGGVQELKSLPWRREDALVIARFKSRTRKGIETVR
jgi:hypothetical protein